MCIFLNILYIVVENYSFLEYYIIAEGIILNKQKLLDCLNKFFSEYSFHSGVINDLLSILKNSGEELKFLKSLIICMTKYEELGRKQAELLREFEPLKNYGEFYSMHVNTKTFNIRIIYSYIDDEMVFLHAFYERDDSKRTGYEVAIKIAKSRMEEI